MKKLLFLIVLSALVATNVMAQRLLIRGDDIGSFHSANLAIIESYTDGIQRSCELMMVTAWTPEAIRMLNENPGLDVGVHLALTSEWDNVKWRPMTHCPSLTDENGFFYPSAFPKADYPGQSITENSPVLAEVEAELRAQIEYAKRNVKNLTHLSSHMAWTMVSPEIAELATRLGEEYGLPMVDARTALFDFSPMRMSMNGRTPSAERIKIFVEALEKLEEGKTYSFIDHPAYDNAEMETVSHIGYENVPQDRQAVTDLFTAPEVKAAIERLGIELVSYGQLIKEKTGR